MNYRSVDAVSGVNFSLFSWLAGSSRDLLPAIALELEIDAVPRGD
jgi:hypothetical protein